MLEKSQTTVLQTLIDDVCVSFIVYPEQIYSIAASHNVENIFKNFFTALICHWIFEDRTFSINFLKV